MSSAAIIRVIIFVTEAMGSRRSALSSKIGCPVESSVRIAAFAVFVSGLVCSSEKAGRERERVVTAAHRTAVIF